MRRFRGEAEDDARKGRERAAQEQANYDKVGEREYAQNRSSWYRDEVPRVSADGIWRFTQIYSESGQLTGWNATLNGSTVGLLVIRFDDILVFSTSKDEDASAPAPSEIMAAFIKLYPDPRVTRALPARAQRQLPSGSPFGPARDWSEE